MNQQYDALIIGGGPGGSTAAYYLATAGLSVLIVEREEFPRFTVGESLLPYNMSLFQEMGVAEKIGAAQFNRKEGAVFGDADSVVPMTRIKFADSLTPEWDHAYQVPRAHFDTILLQHARDHGAELLQANAKDLIFEGDRCVGLTVQEKGGATRDIHAKVVIDSSGRACFIGRKLQLIDADPKLDTAACFGHFSGVQMPSDAQRGDIAIIAFEHGWFWFIPFADGSVSVGTVVDRWVFDQHPDNNPESFIWAMVNKAGGRIGEAMANAKVTQKIRSLTRFNQRCKHFAGPGWVLVGDASMFIDPVFSAGVMMASMEGRMAAQTLIPLLSTNTPVDREHFAEYDAAISDAYELFSAYIYGWKTKAFRAIFYQADQMELLRKTVNTILAGYIFDREKVERGNKVFFKLVANELSKDTTVA